jgi:hypothetical protein
MPKGSFWWRDIMKHSTVFRGIAHCTVGRGDTVSLWEDSFLSQPLLSTTCRGDTVSLWEDSFRSQPLLSTTFPHLFAYAKNTSLSFHGVANTEHSLDLFNLPMSRVGFNELQGFQASLGAVGLDNLEQDSWYYIWNGL